MSNEMIKRIAAAIAESKAKYLVKYYIHPEALDINVWQVWYIEKEIEGLIQSFDDANYNDAHDKAEQLCEQLNNELLAKFAIEAMRDLPKELQDKLDYDCYDAMIDAALKDN